MNPGDRVQMLVDHASYQAGSKGKVDSVLSDGNLVVTLTEDQDGNPCHFPLPPYPASDFAPVA